MLINKLKNKKTEILVITGVLCAVLLIILAGCEGDKNQKENKYLDITSYENRLQKRMIEIIDRINGVSDVNVMLTTDCSAEKVYAVNTQTSEKNTKNEYILSDGTGIPVKEIYPVIRGVAVVCKGGDDPFIQNKIIELVTSVFGISSNRVFVGS